MSRYSFRFPIPDYYTATLEVTRGRTTRVFVETCSPDSLGLLEAGAMTGCLAGVKPGEQYVNRSLDDKCEKMVRRHFISLPGRFGFSTISLGTFSFIFYHCFYIHVNGQCAEGNVNG